MKHLITILGILAALALPVRAGEVKVKTYDQLQVRSAKHEMGDAYLLAYASCYVFPHLIGCKQCSSEKEFTEKYIEKFTPLGLKDITLVSDARRGAQAVVMSNDTAVLVVFRGSEEGDCAALMRDWLTNLNVSQTKVPKLGDGAKVHSGMWKALDSIYDDIDAAVKKQGGRKDKRIYVTGHSMGGSLALLCAARLHSEGKCKPIVYTFGAPRVGNFEFRKSLSEVTVYRWVNKNDLVPMLPSDRFMDYRHVGVTLNITKKGEVEYDDKEYRGLGSRKEHHPFRYVWALHDVLPSDLKASVPDPP